MISIIIRTYNEGRYLEDLLKAIKRQQINEEVETVVVDSGSTDDTLAKAQKGKARIVHIKKSDFTFGRSLNVGCEASRGRILVFISGHCVPTSDFWLMNLCKPFEESSTGISYGRQIGGKETRFSEHQIFEKYFPAHSVTTQVNFFFNNANSAIRRSLWERFRFNESLTGLEDMHIGKQVVENGFSVKYSWLASVYHFHHENWRQVQHRFKREAIALCQIMPEVQLRARDAIRYTLVAILSDLSSALKQKQMCNKLLEIVAYRFCQYSGSWQGHRVHRTSSARNRERYFAPH